MPDGYGVLNKNAMMQELQRIAFENGAFVWETKGGANLFVRALCSNLIARNIQKYWTTQLHQQSVPLL